MFVACSCHQILCICEDCTADACLSPPPCVLPAVEGASSPASKAQSHAEHCKVCCTGGAQLKAGIQMAGTHPQAHAQPRANGNCHCVQVSRLDACLAQGLSHCPVHGCCVCLHGQRGDHATPRRMNVILQA